MIASRPYNKSFGGFYEFPGGKVKKNEFLLEALKRELMEELSVRINVNKLIFLCSYQIKRGRKIQGAKALCNCLELVINFICFPIVIDRFRIAK